MTTLHTLMLTRQGAQSTRDVQSAHGLMRHLTYGEPLLWAQPRADLVIIRAERVNLRKEFIHEHHQQQEQLTSDTIDWSMIAHPVSRHGSTETPLYDQDAIRWAMERLHEAIEIGDIRMETLPKRRGRKWGKPITLHAAAYTGTARIKDHEAYMHLHRDGVGRARAYGFGLLVARSIP